MKKRVQWGYGCGGHCAVNTEGVSEIKASFSSGGAFLLKDKGDQSTYTTFPDDITTYSKNWDITFTGIWSKDGNKWIITMKPESVTCLETTKNRNGIQSKQCTGGIYTQTIHCDKKYIDASTSLPGYDSPEKAIPVKVLYCSSNESDSYPGTQFPWVFGMKKVIHTYYSGEPHPRDYYIIQE